MKEFNFDFLQYANHFKSEFEKAYKERIEDFINKNPHLPTVELLQYISYQYSSMATDISTNLLREYHSHLINYLETEKE